MKELIAKLFDKTFWKFVLVGVANTFFGTVVMFLLYNVFHMSYWISSASNYIFGSILSYFLNKHFTFQNKDKSVKTVVKFVVNISICYLIAYGLAKPVVKYVLSGFVEPVQDNVAMLAGMCLFVVLNYLGQRFSVFKKRGDDE